MGRREDLLKLTFLGSGGAFTDFRVNYHNNVVIDAGTMNIEEPWERYILIDCGATAVQSLKELGIKPWEVAGVIITHLHGDHIAGLEQLIWERFYTGPSGPLFRGTSIFAAPDVLPDLRAILSPCIDEYTDMNGLVHAGGYDRLVRAHEFIPYTDENEAAWVLGDVQFNLYPTRHVESINGNVSKPAYGVRLRAEFGAPAYYTSDTTFDPTIGDRFPDGLIFHDCSFGPVYPGTVHTHYEELLTLPDDVRARIVLMHHTAVPEEIDPVQGNGFGGVATRHSVW